MAKVARRSDGVSRAARHVKRLPALLRPRRERTTPLSRSSPARCFHTLSTRSPSAAESASAVCTSTAPWALRLPSSRSMPWELPRCHSRRGTASVRREVPARGGETQRNTPNSKATGSAGTACCPAPTPKTHSVVKGGGAAPVARTVTTVPPSRGPAAGWSPVGASSGLVTRMAAAMASGSSQESRWPGIARLTSSGPEIAYLVRVGVGDRG